MGPIEELVERLVRSLGRPAWDEESASLALCELDALARVPPSVLAPRVPELLPAVQNWFRVTGGDDVIDRFSEVLEGVETSALVAALEDATRGLEDDAREGYHRELEALAVPCPALFPVVAALRPPAPVDEAQEALVRLASPYVEELLTALSARAPFGSLGAFKAAARARLRSPEAWSPRASLSWAFGELVSVEVIGELTRRIGPRHAPAPNVELGFPEVHVFKRVVTHVRDESVEITPEAIQALSSGSDEVAIGDEVGIMDEAWTRAVASAALRALDLE